MFRQKFMSISQSVCLLCLSALKLENTNFCSTREISTRREDASSESEYKRK